MSDSTSDLSLRGEFVAGQELHSRLEASSLSTTDAAYQRDVRAALAHFETAADLVHRVALFSVNEIVEDINTTDMRFLLVESYQGDLTLRLVGGDRVQILKTAKSYFEQFLFNCDTHDILRAEDKTRLERIKDGAVTQGGDPASARAQKIAQFQREKAIKAKIEELERHLSQTDTRSAPYSSAEFGEVDDADREFVLTLIDLHVLRTLDHLTSVAQEEVMLEEMHRMRERAGDAGGERVDLARDAARLDAGLRGGRADGPLLSKEGKPLRPFVITNQREQIQQQVFRPGWNLPTMTVDEYLQQEKDRGNVISGGGQKERPEKPVPDDNDEAAIDAETYKERDWDEFKEANPRGWGNRMGKG